MDDEFVTAKMACVLFGTEKEPLPQQTLSGWIHRGVLNRHTKERLFLECDMIGGQIRISRAEIRRFLAAKKLRRPS